MGTRGIDHDATVSADPGQVTTPATGAARVYADGELVADRYRIISLLGRGGMGEVYEAHDRSLDQRVALKTLPLDRTDAADRLDRELVLARRVTHPGVCRLFDLGLDERDRRFVTMERLDGETLHDHLARHRRLPPAEVETIVGELAAALAAAHDAGVIHRDLKPHNVFLAAGAAGSRPRVVIMDFGLARREGDARVSVTDFAGTPAYMAPEQLTSRTVTTAVDVYALGLLAFELLTGDLPFAGDPLGGAVVRLQRSPPPLRDAGGPDDARWDRLVHACLATDPAARPTAAAVPALLDAPPPPRRGRRRWPLLAIPVLAVGAATIMLTRGGGRPEPRIDRGARMPFAFSLGGPGDDNVNTIAWAEGGDLFFGGHASAAARLDGHPLRPTDATAHGAYVVRTTSTGRLRWQWSAAGSGDVRVTALAVTKDGDVLAIGVYYQPPTIAGTTLPKPAGESDGFLVRLDGKTGAVRWVRTLRGSRMVFPRALALDADGAIYIACVYGGTVSFAGTVTDTPRNKDQGHSPLVASFTADGEPRWLVAGHGAYHAKAFGLAVDGGRVIMSGMVWNTFELGGVTIPSRPPGDAVVIALDAATGRLLWHQLWQSTGPPEASASDVNAVAARDGRVVVTGYYQRGLDLGSMHLPGDAPMNLFVAELAAGDGTPRWAFAFGGTGYSIPNAIALTADGRAIVSGRIHGDVQFGATAVRSAGDEDGFIGVVDRAGRPVGYQRLGGTARDRARTLAVAPDGRVAVGGMFAGQLDAGRFHLSGRGANDGFVVQLDLAAAEQEP